MGVLFIIATVAAILGSLVITKPNLDDPDYLFKFSANKNRVLIGVLIELIAAGAVVGTGVMLFPVFKNHNEALALAYFGGRSIEGVLIIGGAISALLLLSLSREYVAGASDAYHFQTLGTLLLAKRDWSLLVGPMIVFSINALILNYLFYQSRLVPLFISVWGLIGAPLVLAAGLLVMFDLAPLVSIIVILLVLPIALNEMVLALWLIVNGFH